MKETIKNDMYGKIKDVKAIASKALGQVELDSKVLKTTKLAKANLDMETKTSKNATSESAQHCTDGKVDLKAKILKKLALKKADAKTEVPVTKSKLVEESAGEVKEVKKVPDQVTKAQKAKALAKAKKADAKETKLKK